MYLINTYYSTNFVSNLYLNSTNKSLDLGNWYSYLEMKKETPDNFRLDDLKLIHYENGNYFCISIYIELNKSTFK